MPCYLLCAVVLVAAPPLPDPEKSGADNGGSLEEQGHAHDDEPGQWCFVVFYVANVFFLPSSAASFSNCFQYRGFAIIRC